MQGKIEIEIKNNCDYVDYTFEVEFKTGNLSHFQDGLWYHTVDFDNLEYDINYAYNSDGESFTPLEEHEALINQWIDENHNQLNEQLS
jgi:hypothetical protein